MKKINLIKTFLLLLLLGSKISFAQLNPSISSKNIQWQKCLGGTHDDRANDVLLNPDGTMVIVGYSKSNDGDVSGHHGVLDSSDAWVAKVDALGNVIWQRSIGGSNADEFNSVIAAGNGNYLCIGYTRSADGDIAFNNGQSDCFIVKIDGNGNILWSKSFGGALADVANNGIMTSDGGYAIIGNTNSYDGDVQSKGYGRTDQDAWTFKLDNAGNILWEQCLNYNGGTSADIGLDITEVPDKSLLAFIRGNDTYTQYYEPELTFYYALYPGVLFRLDAGTGASSIFKIISTSNYVSSNYNYLNEYSMARAGNQLLFSYGSYYYDGYPDEEYSGGMGASSMNIDGTGATFISATDYYTHLYTIEQFPQHPAPIHGIAGINNSIFSIVGTDGNNYYGNTTEAMISNFGDVGGYGDDGFNSVKIYPNGNEFVAVGYTNSKSGNIAGLHGNDEGAFDCLVVKFINTNKITGNVFIDLNGNGVKDAGEPSFDKATVSSVRNGITQKALPSQGFYTNVVDTGTYTTTIAFDQPYYTTTNSGAISALNSYGSNATVNFPVRPIAGVKDYAVTATALQSARPNVDVEYVITYSNKGTDTLTNRTLYFIKDDRTTFGYSAPLPVKISGDTLFWTVSNITPDSSASIKFYLKMDPIPLLNVKDSLTNIVYIDSAGDANSSDNSFLLRQIVVGSFDPNDKLESHGGFITPDEMIAEKKLCYTIRFQNNGNDVASSIIVRDTLDKKLDGSSIEMAACSHSYQLNIQNGKYITWTFNNINLPDSISSDSLSKGYISYKIKPLPGFKTGDTIRNSASIYFDFNPPISTNTQLTIFTAEKDMWTGAKSTAWENPLNWSAGKVPDAGVDVIINNGMINYPVVNSNASCRTITVNPGATITVNTNYAINVEGGYLP